MFIKVNGITTINGEYEYYHYECDGHNDRGWGCGYRTMQTIVSWVTSNLEGCQKPRVESIPKYQSILEHLEQNVTEGGREWIGTIEAGYVLDMLYQIPCRIINCGSKDQIMAHFDEIKRHFESNGAPLMMGGGQDHYSKGVFGCSKAETTGEVFLLIVDPHYTTDQKLNKFVFWLPVSELGELQSLYFTADFLKSN